MASADLGTREFLNELRQMRDEGRREFTIDIKTQGEQNLKQLKEELEKLQNDSKIDVEVNIPKIKKQIEDVSKQLSRYESLQSKRIQSLETDIVNASSKYFETQSTKVGQHLADLLATYKKITGNGFSFDIVPNLDKNQIRQIMSALSTEIQNKDIVPKILEKNASGKYDYSDTISKRKEELDSLQIQLSALEQSITDYDVKIESKLLQISEAEENLRKIDEQIAQDEEKARKAEEQRIEEERRILEEEERLRREKEKNNQPSWKTGRKREQSDEETDWSFIEEEIDKTSEDANEDLTKTESLLKRLSEAVEKIAKALGAIDDQSGLPNVIQQLNDVLSKLNLIQEKAGNGVFNVSLGSASDQSKMVDEKMAAKWTETYQRYMKTYDKIFKSISDIYKSPDTLFAKIYSMNPDQQDIDQLKEMFGKNAILSLQDPKEQVRRLTEFFKYVQQIVDTVDDGSDDVSQAIASVMSKSDNRVSTNFKAIESRVNKIRSESIPDNESLEESLQNSIKEMAEAEAQSEDWQGNLLKILKTLNEIKQAFENIANIDLFNTESFNEFKKTIEDLSSSLSTLNTQQNASSVNAVNELSDAFANEQKISTEAAETESDSFATLEDKIRKIITAVDEKTQSFSQEKISVETAIQYELKLLDDLIAKLEYVNQNAKIDIQLSNNQSINDVINNKTSLFGDEDDVVSGIVNHEIEILDQLKNKIDSICSLIEEKIHLFNTEAANINKIAESLRALNNVSLSSADGNNANNYTDLESSLINIIQLINDKTNAFNAEGQVVDAVVGAEIDKLNILSETIRLILESIKNIDFGNVSSPKWISDLQSVDPNKFSSIAKSISEMYDAISGLSIDDSNIVSSIDRILNKGKELESLVKVISSSKRKIQSVEKNTSNNKEYTEELNRRKRLAKISHEFEMAKAAGRDDTKLHAKYDEEKRQLEELGKTKNKLNKQQQKDIENEIAIINKRYQSEENAIREITEQKARQKIQDDDLGNIDSQIGDLEKVKNQLNDLSQNTGKIMPEYLTSIQEKVNELQQQIDDLNKQKIDIVNSDDLSDLEEAEKKTRELIDESNKVKKGASEAVNKIGKEVKIKNLDDQITDFLTKNTKLSAEFRAELNALQQKLRGGQISAQDISDIAAAFADVKVRAKEAGDIGRSTIDSISQRLSDMNNKFIAHFFSFADLIRYGRQAIEVIRDLDTQLVDLRKTTKMNNDELEEFYSSSNKIAKQLGTSTSQIISQAAAWSRLGYNTKEASENMATLSSQFAAISPGMSLDDATDGLVSTMKAFHIDVKDTERDIMDNVNRIGNTFATSNDEIMEMLKRSSAAMAAANNTIEETIALESAAVQITRNAETTGTAFRTISMRIRGFDEETEELSEDLKNITGDIADLTKTAKTPGGISVFKEGDPNTYKSTYEILKDISDIWNDLTDKQQAGLLEKIGGKRGAQSIADILRDFSEVERAMDEMKNSAGAADEEMKIIEESLDYKINKLKETWVGIAQDLIDRGVIGNIVDGLTSISEAIANISKGLGGLPQIIGTVVGAVASIKGVGRENSYPSNMPTYKELLSIDSFRLIAA